MAAYLLAVLALDLGRELPPFVRVAGNTVRGAGARPGDSALAVVEGDVFRDHGAVSGRTVAAHVRGRRHPTSAWGHAGANPAPRVGRGRQTI